MNTPIDNTAPQLVAVSYISRSGSTLLCRLLDQYEGISSGIEAGFPGAPDQLIPDQFRSIGSRANLDKYLDLLFGDVRFKEWNLDRYRLVGCLERSGYPMTFRDILNSCLEEYFHGKSIEVLIHKAGYFIDMLDDVSATFGPMRNIYIIRDPRAIFFSQRSASSIYTGKSMASALPHFIYQYKKRQRIASTYQGDSLMTVRYEDLVNDSRTVLESILDFIGKPGITAGASNYAERIPDNQKSLHVNVTAPPGKQSLEKWKNGLEKHELMFIQRKLANEMHTLGYQMAALDESLTDYSQLLMNHLRYAYFLLRKCFSR